jgi:hypothetical protein
MRFEYAWLWKFGAPAMRAIGGRKEERREEREEWVDLGIYLTM